MLQLIKKDFLFNLKWALLLALVAAAMPFLLYIDQEETRLVLVVYVIGSILTNAHFVSKSCYLDDGVQTRRFLASLPVRRAELVLSKYILGLLCIVATLFMISVSSIAFGLSLSVQGMLIAAICLLLYYAVFLGVYFRSNYSNAEKANAGFQMLTVMGVFVLDRSGISLDEMSINPLALLAGLGACAAFYVASIGLSVRASRYSSK